MPELCTSTSAPGLKSKSIIKEQTDFLSCWTDAHLAAIRWCFTNLKFFACFWSWIAHATIRSWVDIISGVVGAIYVALARLNGRSGSIPWATVAQKTVPMFACFVRMDLVSNADISIMLE